MALAWLLTALTACAPAADDNAGADARIALGQRLFEDPQLSADGRLSCAGCHASALRFTDGRPVSIGVGGAQGTRNAPSVNDVGLMTSFFWDGRETRLEDVVLQPFTNPVEMGLADRAALIARVSQGREYRRLLASAYGDDRVEAGRLVAALSAYLRSLPLTPTRYDLHRASEPGAALSADEAAGLALFAGKAGCADCHRLEGAPAALTDNRFHHTGVGFEQVAGNVAAMLQQLDELQRQRKPIGEAVLASPQIAQLGRFAATRRSADLGAFRTPSLRDVASTAPYMHDGSIASLAEAVEREIYYRSLARGRPISLTVEEQRQLLAFLQTLSTPTPAAR
jgi:cytochrome c peroxidase